MAKPQVRAVYSTDFTPQSNAVVTPKPAPTPVLNEKTVVKLWFKKMLLSVLKKLFFVIFFVNLGSFLEYKYHWLGAPYTQSAMKAKGFK